MGSVSMIHNDSIIFEKAIGFANVEEETLNNETTGFRIGSITKTYTAVLILKAIEENKLSINHTLDNFFPQFINANKISVANLLEQKSGIYNYSEIENQEFWEQQFHTPNEIINNIASQKSTFEPGTKFEYSNSNYVLLGYILEKIYNKSYEEILKEKITSPLNLQRTYYTFETNPFKNEALSYNIQNKYIQNTTINYSNHIGGGGIVSTASEVNKFLSALFNEKIISKKSIEIMLPKEKYNYGYGIFKLPFDNPIGYEHSGRVANYISQYWYFPSENLGIVTLCNATNINPDAVQMTLLRKAFKLELNLPDFDKIDDLTKEEFSMIKGTYIESTDKDLITISSDGTNLVFQSSEIGQDYVTLIMKEKYVFEYDTFSIQFDPSNKKLKFEQNGIIKYYELIH